MDVIGNVTYSPDYEAGDWLHCSDCSHWVTTCPRCDDLNTVGKCRVDNIMRCGSSVCPHK